MQKAPSCASVTSHQTPEIHPTHEASAATPVMDSPPHKCQGMENTTGEIEGGRNRVSGDIALIQPDLLSSIKPVMQQISPNKSFNTNLMGFGKKTNHKITGTHHQAS